MADVSGSIINTDSFLEAFTNLPFAVPNATFVNTSNVTNIFSGSVVTEYTVFRGRVGSTYVYTIGTIPGGGATDIVIFKV